MDRLSWNNRIRSRNDMATRLVHLTRGVDANDAFEVLWKILNDKKINGGLGFVNGERSVVCLQELPLVAIAENLTYEEKINDKVRYSPFGIRFHKEFIYRNGGRPVFYENKEVAKTLLPEREYWRIVDLNLSDKKRYVDWTHEREWRVPDELPFDYENIEIIVKNGIYYRRLVERCIKNKKEDILMGIHGIITLNSIYL